jgi:hypothetical protein
MDNMHVHSRQLRKIHCSDGRKDKAVPPWVPPAFIIPLIDKKKEKQAPPEQPRVEIDDNVPDSVPEDKPGGEGYKDPRRAPKEKDEERGVWEIQF